MALLLPTLLQVVLQIKDIIGMIFFLPEVVHYCLSSASYGPNSNPKFIARASYSASIKLDM